MVDRVAYFRDEKTEKRNVKRRRLEQEPGTFIFIGERTTKNKKFLIIL